MRAVLVFCLIGCSGDLAPPIDHGDAGVIYSTPVPTASPPPAGPCGKTELRRIGAYIFYVPIPCQPYARSKDLADPQP